jgi:hypothetical protein
VASTRPQATTAAVPKLRYIVVTLMGIFAILGVQLMLSIAVSGGAYEIASLKGEMRQTEQKRQMVAEDINALVAPDTLAGLASSMGMVADNNPAYLRLSDASVVGEAVPAPSNAGAQLFPVTSGTETGVVPAIVSAVFESVMTAEIDEVAPELTAAAEATDTGPTVTPASVVVEPEIRFGGTIPSPTTR